MRLRYGWSPHRADWLDFGKTVADLEWKTFPFHLVYCEAITTESGVYMICLPSSHFGPDAAVWRNMNSPMYVGQSGNLRDRFRQHVQGLYKGTQQLATQFSGLVFWYCEIKPAAQIDTVESLLIQTFGPPYNTNKKRPFSGVIGSAVKIPAVD
jgi:excinuclease UvrABC nuclease subunit